MKKSLILASAILFGVAGAAHAYYYEGSSPHNYTRQIACEDCHNAPVWGDPNGSNPYLLNNVSATGDTDCVVCHVNGSGTGYTQTNAPKEETHSSANITTDYGFWGFECWNCHQNHEVAPEPTEPKMVSGSVSSKSQSLDGKTTTFSMSDFTVYNVDQSVNDCLDMINNGDWCTPEDWATKTNEQAPYNPVADPNSAAITGIDQFTGGPCDPGPDGIPQTGDDVYDPYAPGANECVKGVDPRERGLVMWVTLDSGTRAGFEVVDSTIGQIKVAGQLPSGEDITFPAAFELRYGMMVKSQVDQFGYCSPDPVYSYCKETASGIFTEPCTTTADCITGETCEPRAMPTQCVADADCPTGESCVLQTQGPVAFWSPRNLAIDETPGDNIDETPNGICQTCHTQTAFWKADGTGVNHNNGQTCTRCHLHSLGFAPGGGCNTCHGFPPSQSEFPIVYIDGTSGSLTAGAHVFHATSVGYSFACENCHVGGMKKSSDKNNAIEIGFGPFGINGTGTAYHPDQTAHETPPYSYRGTNGTVIIPEPGTDPLHLTCSNVYCHSQGKYWAQGFDLPQDSNPWDAGSSEKGDPSTKCDNCHNYPPTFDSHKFHNIRGYTCDLCHNSTVQNTASGMIIKDKKKHVNGVYDVEAGPLFFARNDWNPLYFDYTRPAGGIGSGTCSNNACHQYWRFKDPKPWINKPQQFTNAVLTATNGQCLPGAATGAVSINVSTSCSDCVPFVDGYHCDFDWGDGQVDYDVPCNGTSHTYADDVPYQAPDGSIVDPNNTVIGGFNVTWTMRDQYNVTLPDDGVDVTRVEVCPLPNVQPTVNYSIALGPNPNTYDACITDLSIDSDYNVGTHYDKNNPPYYAAPGQVKIEWGGYAADGSGLGKTDAAVYLRNTPSNEQFCFTYSRSGYYWVKYSIKDNAGGSAWVQAPLQVFKVTK